MQPEVAKRSPARLAATWARTTPARLLVSHTAIPASPSAATAVVARMNTGSATSRNPAVRSASTKGAQLVVPRRISAGLSQWVVTKADSMNSGNGGE